MLPLKSLLSGFFLMTSNLSLTFSPWINYIKRGEETLNTQHVIYRNAKEQEEQGTGLASEAQGSRNLIKNLWVP